MNKTRILQIFADQKSPFIRLTRVTRIPFPDWKADFTGFRRSKIRVHPLNPRHPRSISHSYSHNKGPFSIQKPNFPIFNVFHR